MRLLRYLDRYTDDADRTDDTDFLLLNKDILYRSATPVKLKIDLLPAT